MIRPLISALFLMTICMLCATSSNAAPTMIVVEKSQSIRKHDDGTILVDFGRVSFGNIHIMSPGENQSITVHFGEAQKDQRINRNPGGTIRYIKTTAELKGEKSLVAPPADKRNTTLPAAILTPKEWGVVLPFRWVEIEGWKGDFSEKNIQRNSAFASTWDDQAASFQSSDKTLDAIWELCRYSIKATTFAGVYVDGDRERIPYEADAYLNQLSHYACDPDPLMARDTYDHLMKQPTWPTEWAPHMIFMAHAEWMQTGDQAWIASRFEALKKKTLSERARADGLLVSNQKQQKRDDIVDWPTTERDGYVFTPVNTVVNAFHLRALQLMSELANAAHKPDDAKTYQQQYQKTLAAFQEKLIDPQTGIFKDGESTKHSSLHANLFPLAFGLVPEKNRTRVIAFIKQRGMRCSVYAAQYLLEGLYEQGEAQTALELMLADGDRSWKHMLNSGTSITWEAWDNKYKPNQDWNHAWGAAPANILPRYVIGVRPTKPGWSEILIAPQPASLTSLLGKVPSPRGPVHLKWEKATNIWQIALPPGVSALISLPASENTKALVNGKAVPTTFDAKTGRILLQNAYTGKVSITLKN
ncbi:MAG TPA: alpha-L-rhamnosidase [Verrucomicrobiales bacterium]|nr:MAG: alpha-L-rhamnosidase [Verrucomicrobiae bacterium Tous-C3TDCM]PAZ04501.1 MAG: alpha-L-rhamnosidase [Verrucomicrobiae bacterium AMD-G2]HBE22348.1 alpha-L-rhamnosidase [Verrucomicrobiales bacterium]